MRTFDEKNVVRVSLFFSVWFHEAHVGVPSENGEYSTLVPVICLESNELCDALLLEPFIHSRAW